MSGNMQAITLRLFIVSIVLMGTFILSCNTFDGNQLPNQPPEVWLTSGPPEGGVSSYIVHFFWNGWDKDGDIHHFEFAITDNEGGAFDPADTTGPDKWHKTFEYDSIFTFSADEISDTSSSDMITEFTRSHTFFIRAVDDKGLVSVKAAYRSFTAKTLSPTVDITLPEYFGLNPAIMPPIATFRWIATDYVDNIDSKQEPAFVRWILVSTEAFSNDFGAAIEYIRNNPLAPEWSEWQNYLATNGSGKSWTTPPTIPGTYIFAVQAKDEAGAVTPVFDETRNVRRILISTEGTGPIITLCSDLYNACWKSNSLNQPLAICDLPGGTPLTFTLQLADYYSGSPIEYCYGWDITEPSCEQWTPYPGQPVTITLEETAGWFFGTHTFHVVASNASGFKSMLGVKFNIIPFTMERNLLVVDDYREDPAACGIERTNGALPCDDEHDAFWEAVLQNVEGFEPVVDMIEVGRTSPLPIEKLARYKNVIWNVRGGYNLQDELLPYLYDCIKFTPLDPDRPATGYVQPNLLALFLVAGGHVLICGEQPMTMAIDINRPRNPKYPFIFLYELGGNQDGTCFDPVGENSFAYRDMCLDVLDIAYTSYDMLRTTGENGCGVTHIRSVRPMEDGLREATPIDVSFPALTLRHEVAETGKHFAPESRGLNNEIYDPMYFTCCAADLGPQDCFEPIYGHGCLDDSSPLYGSPVAAWTSKYADVVPDVESGVAVAARSAVWGFEPFYFEPAAVRSALEIILFDEWQLPSK